MHTWHLHKTLKVSFVTFGRVCLILRFNPATYHHSDLWIQVTTGLARNSINSRIGVECQGFVFIANVNPTLRTANKSTQAQESYSASMLPSSWDIGFGCTCCLKFGDFPTFAQCFRDLCKHGRSCFG